MAPLSVRAFRRRLRRLDGGALAAFVSDVYAARGAAATAEGSRVRLGDGREVRCVPGGRVAGRLRPGDPDVGDADIVVAARDDDAARSAAAGAGARFVGPDGLRDMLLYAVDREDADELCRRHLGRSLSGGERRRPGRARTALAVALVVAVVAAAVAVAGGPGWPAASGSAATPAVEAAPAAGTPTDPTGAAVADGNGSAYPAGLGPDGITDIDALVARHRAALDNRSHQVLIRGRGRIRPVEPVRTRAGLIAGPPVWRSFRQRISVEHPTVYRSRVTGRLARDGAAGLTYDDYADGVSVYRRYGGNATPKFARVESRGAVVTAAVGEYLDRYLDTTETRVQRRGDGYRIVATGRPRALGEPLSDYLAVADVSPAGLVFRLRVTYKRPMTPATLAGGPRTAGDAAETYGLLLTYSDVGAERVPRPPWYDRARSATGASAHPAGIDPGAADPVDAVALAESHGAALDGASYRWHLRHRGTESGGLIDGRWARSDQHAVVTNGSTFAFSARGTAANASDGGRVAFDVYAAGGERYERLSGGENGTRYRRYGVGPEAVDADPVAELAERYVRRYLATDEATVTVVGAGSDRRYRVVATGRPRLLGDRVDGYRATATVTAGGLVRNLSVSYASRTDSGTVPAEFEFGYRRGNVTLRRPAWVAAARNATA